MKTHAPKCPKCGYRLHQAIPDAPAKVPSTVPVKQYAIERKYGVKRMNGGFS